MSNRKNIDTYIEPQTIMIFRNINFENLNIIFVGHDIYSKTSEIREFTTNNNVEIVDIIIPREENPDKYGKAYNTFTNKLNEKSIVIFTLAYNKTNKDPHYRDHAFLFGAAITYGALVFFFDNRENMPEIPEELVNNVFFMLPQVMSSEPEKSYENVFFKTEDQILEKIISTVGSANGHKYLILNEKLKESTLPNIDTIMSYFRGSEVITQKHEKNKNENPLFYKEKVNKNIITFYAAGSLSNGVLIKELSESIIRKKALEVIPKSTVCVHSWYTELEYPENSPEHILCSVKYAINDAVAAYLCKYLLLMGIFEHHQGRLRATTTEVGIMFSSIYKDGVDTTNRKIIYVCPSSQFDDESNKKFRNNGKWWAFMISRFNQHYATINNEIEISSPNGSNKFTGIVDRISELMV